MIKKLFSIIALPAISTIQTSLVWGQSSNTNPGTHNQIGKKIIRKDGPSTRPKMPTNPNDYLTYSILNSMLHVAYPANSLPATVQIVDNHIYSCTLYTER